MQGHYKCRNSSYPANSCTLTRKPDEKISTLGTQPSQKAQDNDYKNIGPLV